MGLFDKLTKQSFSGLKDRLEKAANIDIDGALDKLTGAIDQGVSRVTNGTANDTAASTTRYTSSQPYTPADTSGYSSYTPPAQDRGSNAYFASILNEAFSQYTVKTSVSAAELGFSACLPAKAFDFALTEGGVCRAVIMLTPRNRDNNAAFKNAKAAAQGAGVEFINFYTHFPNERSYVIARINSFLN